MDFKFTEKNELTKEEDEEKIKVVFSGSFEDSEENREVIIPEGIEEIAENTFRGFTNLETVTFPKSLKVVSASAFADCKNLKSVNMNTGLEEIGDEAFYRNGGNDGSRSQCRCYCKLLHPNYQQR